MSVFRKGSMIIVILVGCYALIGFLIIPFLVRHFGEKALQEHLSPESAITKVRMNPFRLSMQVEGLRTADPTGGWTAEWQSFQMDMSAKTFVKFYPVLDLIALDGSVFAFERTLEERESAQAAGDVESTAGWRELMSNLNEMEMPKLHVDLLEIREGQVTFSDHTNVDPYVQDLHPINFSLSNITTVSGDATQMQLSAQTARGAVIEWEGTVDTHPLRSAGTFTLQSLHLENFAPYYDQFTQFNLQTAVFGVSFDYVLNASDLDNLVAVSNAQVALTELLCEATGENARLLSIDDIVVEGGSFQFPQMKLGIERIGISGGQTLVHRNADGSINLFGLIAVQGAGRVAEVQEDTADAAEDSGFTYHVDLIEVLNYQLSWEEEFESDMANFAIQVPTLRVEGVSSDLDQPFTFFSDYRIGDGGKMVLEGSVVTASTKVAASVKIKDLPLTVGAVYAKEFGGVLLESGILNVEGQVGYDAAAGVTFDGVAGVDSFTAGYGEDLSVQWEALTMDLSAQFEVARRLDVTGTVDLNGFAASSGAGLEAQFHALALKGFSLTTDPMAVRLEGVSLKAPVIRVRKSGGVPSCSDEPDAEPLASKEAVGSTSRPLALLVGVFSVEQGALTLVDESVAPSATIAVTEMTASVKNVDTSSATPVDLDLSAKVNKSPFKLAGQLQPNDLKAGTALQFQLSALSLPAFSSYTALSVGRRISKGALSLDSDWTIQDSELKASNQILVNQLKFGDKVESEDALNLPLDLAVTLLAGPSGEMDLSLPLSGDLSDPKASLGQIIRAAVVGIVTNAAAAPFKLLSGLVGSEEDLSVVEFADGGSSLSNEMLDRLNEMAEALKQRPELQLEIIPVISAEDKAALAILQLRAQILEDPLHEDDKKFRKGVTKLYRKKMEDAGTPDRETDADTADGLRAMLSVILSDVALPEGEFERLAAERGEVVSKHLIASHGIEPRRLNVIEFELSDGSIGLRFDLR